MTNTVRRVLVTGANGNLGGKLIRTLLASAWCESLIAVDRGFAENRLPEDTRLARIAGDLRDAAGARRRIGLWFGLRRQSRARLTRVVPFMPMARADA